MIKSRLSKFWFPPDWDSSAILIRIGWGLLGIGSVGACLLMLVIFVNHLAGPEITRGVMFEEVSRLTRGLSLYPAPSGDYVAITYAPFFPLLSALFAKIFGLSAGIIRFVAVLGSIGSWVLIFKIVQQETESLWFALLAAGLFAGAYLAFDGYLDYAQPDSWLLFMGLLGIWVLHKARSVRVNVLGIVILCGAFWFKQHAVFLIGAGLLYITWRDGLVKSVPHWIIAALLAPVAYLILGPALFGDHFLYFTYQVPSAWTEFNGNTIPRYVGYIADHWIVLAPVSILGVAWEIWRRRRPSIWVFAFPFALLIGFLATLDPGSENNAYLVPSVWFIIVGTIALKNLVKANKPAEDKLSAVGRKLTPTLRSAITISLLMLSFFTNLYNPLKVFTPPEAWHDYNDLILYIRNLNGIVYMPGIGQLPGDIRLPMVAGWVNLEDLIRGPGHDERNNPLIRSLLSDLIAPKGNAYIITQSPLETDPVLGFLSSDYTLVDNLGDHFKSLKAVPGRFSGGDWPRYVYAFRGNKPSNPPSS